MSASPAAVHETLDDVRTIAGLRGIAARHPSGHVDLSTASPVDPPSPALLALLAAAPAAPGYPSTQGSASARAAVIDWLERQRGITGITAEQVAVTIGSKEVLGLMPFLLGLGRGATVVAPRLAYPAYADGAAAVDAAVVAEDDPDRWPASTRLVWLNSPRNPDGRVLTAAQLRRAVERARALGAIIIDDECYGVLNDHDAGPIPSILHEESNGGSLDGILMSASVSKQSNLAGYRAGFLVGDPALVARLVARRRQVGLIAPAPTQVLLAAALGDDAHVSAQRARYRRRAAALRPALEAAGFRVDADAGMYLWATRGEDCWASAAALARHGVLTMPGRVFGGDGGEHIRLALSIDDARLDEAISRLASEDVGAVARRRDDADSEADAVSRRA